MIKNILATSGLIFVLMLVYQAGKNGLCDDRDFSNYSVVPN